MEPSGFKTDSFDNLASKGLRPEHYSELNTLWESNEERLTRLVELRCEYINDPLALEELDRLDGSSPYNARLPELIAAFKTGDEEVITKLHNWYKENYPFTEVSEW
jgi:hypothetical protein